MFEQIPTIFQQLFHLKFNFRQEKSLRMFGKNERGRVSFNVQTKSKLQVRILVPQNCRLHQRLPNSPKNEKNLWHIHFKVLRRPSISRRFAIFNYIVFIFKQFLIKNSESAGNRRFFENFEMNVSQVFLVLWGVRKSLMQLAVLWD